MERARLRVDTRGAVWLATLVRTSGLDLLTSALLAALTRDVGEASGCRFAVEWAHRRQPSWSGR
jgi:hypothetical protein